MFEKIRDLIANSRILQFVLTLLLGIAVGAIFYPTKHIEEKLTKIHQEEIASLNVKHKKELTEEHDEFLKVASEFHQYHDESEKKISTLTTQVTSLKSKQKTSYYKLVKPDGTIEIKKFTESEVDESTKIVTSIQEEFKQKIDSIENKWETIHKQRVVQIQKEFDSKEETYKKTIDELHQSKVVDINKKSFGIEAGVLTNLDYYGHVSYDIFGPIFIGAHGQFGSSSAAGAGLGLRF